tara:strand:- start:79 stop:270 length:192 start_codon:yes stop_codon:yes gene_type:complete
MLHYYYFLFHQDYLVVDLPKVCYLLLLIQLMLLKFLNHHLIRQLFHFLYMKHFQDHRHHRLLM